MTTIKAQVTVDIWDDPYFCSKSCNEKCPQLTETGKCGKFKTGHPDNFVYMVNPQAFIKCPECKKVWQEANTGKHNKNLDDLINERMNESIEAEH